MHKYIRTAQTGTPKQFAYKLGLSERSIYNYISFMKKEMSAPIIYDNRNGNYYYKRICELNFNG